MLLSLTMAYDEDEYKDMYPDLSNDELIQVMKEDFFETMTQMEWSSDFVNSIEVVED